MTLEAYRPEQFDQLALRALDLAAELRSMANISRNNAISECPLHDKKALEWLTKLEDWTHKTSARLELLAVRQRALGRAEAVAALPRKARPARRKKRS